MIPIRVLGLVARPAERSRAHQVAALSGLVLMLAACGGTDVPSALRESSEQLPSLCEGSQDWPGGDESGPRSRAVIVRAAGGELDSEYAELPSELRASSPHEARYLICLQRSEEAIGVYQPGNATAFVRAHALARALEGESAADATRGRR